MVLSYYQYISRKQSLDSDLSLADIFGAKKLRKQVMPVIEKYNKDYRYETQDITDSSMVSNFYHNLYRPFISAKD